MKEAIFARLMSSVPDSSPERTSGIVIASKHLGFSARALPSVVPALTRL